MDPCPNDLTIWKWQILDFKVSQAMVGREEKGDEGKQGKHMHLVLRSISGGNEV